MNPKLAKHLLDSHRFATPIGKSQKLAAYKLSSGRELALSTQNKEKTSLYIELRPETMVGVRVEKQYSASSKKSGRNSNLNHLTENLGFSSVAYRVTVSTEQALNELLSWYLHA